MELNEQLAQASGRPVIYNLILAMAQDQHGNKMEGHHKTIAWLNEANARGNRIFGQAVTVKIGYEFTLEHWNMFDTFELWREMTLGTVEERMTKMADPERRALTRRVRLATSESPYVNEVEISAGGETYRGRIRREDYLGSPRNPMSDEQLEAKFIRNASAVVGESQAKEMAALIGALEQVDDIRQLTRLLAPTSQ